MDELVGIQRLVTTDRKPRPGLKQNTLATVQTAPTGHDGPKTQTGIETDIMRRRDTPGLADVTTDRKPRPGLKPIWPSTP